jgi:hypothetical protein
MGHLSQKVKEGIEVLAYDYIEAFAEKFRALSERARPRDLYDVVNLYRNADARPERAQFVDVLREKCAFKGRGLPQLVELEPHRADLEAGWIHMLNHQLPALLPIGAFWDALPEIFAWLEGAAEIPALTPLRMGVGETIIRERVVGFPAGSPGQSLIEMIRFAAANRLLVEIDYLDKHGQRAKRAIEPYSLRRSRACEVLMAVRSEDGQPRSYLVRSILGATSMQTSFAPRYPIELTPSGPQSVPALASGGQNAPQIRRNRRRSSSSGMTYVFRCTVCRKLFYRKSMDHTLRPHKTPSGRSCYGTYGTYVRTKS